LDRTITALQAWLSGTPDLLVALAAIWLWGGQPWIPYAVLTIGTLPTLLVHTRSAIASALAHDSVKAARLYRIRGFRLWTSYVLPLAAAPLVALAGLSFGTLLSASLLVEAALSYPGIGSLMLDAIQARDTAVAAAVTAIAGFALLSANLLADVALRWLDPRNQQA
jgi:peptide/nickel transport system permease protein